MENFGVDGIHDPAFLYASVKPWRTGRKLGRTVYAVIGNEPSDGDLFIGIMDTPKLAAMVVEQHNRAIGGM